MIEKLDTGTVKEQFNDALGRAQEVYGDLRVERVAALLIGNLHLQRARASIRQLHEGLLAQKAVMWLLLMKTGGELRLTVRDFQEMPETADIQTAVSADGMETVYEATVR